MMRPVLFAALLGLSCGCGADPVTPPTSADAGLEAAAGDAGAGDGGFVFPEWVRFCDDNGRLTLVEATPAGAVEVGRWSAPVEDLHRTAGTVYLYGGGGFFPAGTLAVDEGPAGTYRIRAATFARVSGHSGIANARFTLAGDGLLVLDGNRLRGASTWTFTATAARGGAPVTGSLRWEVDASCPLSRQ